MDIDHTAAQLIKHIYKVSREAPSILQAEMCNICEQFKHQPNVIEKLGTQFYRLSNYNYAFYCFEYLIKQNPRHFSAYNNLGLVLNRFGLGHQAAEAYRRALAIKPDFHPSRSNLAYVLHYFGETGREEILEAHKDVAKYAFPNSKDFIKNKVFDLSQNRKLRLGYLSGDFREHAVGHFIQGILTKHDREQFDIHIFDTRNEINDPTTEKLRGLELKWHNIKGLVTQAACSKIASKKIDILIDLAGHTAGGRVDVFGNRVAPVQLTYLGYPNTSGLPTMDFRIGDNFADLERFEIQNTEHMLRMPYALWNYQPWNTMPESTGDSSCEKNGYVTFGSANNHAKLQPEWLEQWAKVIQQVPNSRLVLKSKSMQNAQVVKNVLAIFAKQGVDNSRLELSHFSPTREAHWHEVSRFDIALDSFPYNGTTTTCDLLYLGVPVVTRAGNSHVSRTSGSILHTLGLYDWIAYSDDEFVALCVKKAKDLTALIELKASLKNKMLSSSLMDSDLFVSDYEKILRKAWRIHCEKEPNPD